MKELKIHGKTTIFQEKQQFLMEKLLFFNIEWPFLVLPYGVRQNSKAYYVSEWWLNRIHIMLQLAIYNCCSFGQRAIFHSIACLMALCNATFCYLLPLHSQYCRKQIVAWVCKIINCSRHTAVNSIKSITQSLTK